MNRPLTFAGRRRMTFGLQASPVKPRPPDWRTRYWTGRVGLVGCDFHWFALGCCGSVYPANRDLSLWHMVRRANRRAFAEEEFREGFAAYRRHLAPHPEFTEDEGRMRELEQCARTTLQQREGLSLVFYFNRSSSPVIEEYQTFMDEWGVRAFCDDRDTDEPLERRIVPTPSYLDFAAWWYVKSFEHAGNTGIYVDNNYFAPSFNRFFTGAYRRDDGTTAPSNGLWGLRELGRRQFRLLHEQGRYPWNMVHTSTLEILPINAFYTVRYDGEWKHSEGDFHTRYSRAYLLAMSTGDHLGAIPLFLHEQGPLVGDPWTSRTWMGVCLVHEITIDHYVWHQAIPPPNPVYDLFRKPVTAIALRPGVVVYRYWEERPQPVAADDPDLPGIVYSVPGEEALCVFTNFAGESREARVRIDLGALGLQGPCETVDIETGARQDVRPEGLCFTLRSHDLKAFRVRPVAAADAAPEDRP